MPARRSRISSVSTHSATEVNPAERARCVAALEAELNVRKFDYHDNSGLRRAIETLEALADHE